MKHSKIAKGEYGINPFTAPLRIKVTKKVEQGDVTYREREPYTKVFMTVESRESMLQLSMAGYRMFAYICHNLESNEDFIKIDVKRFMEYCGIKSAKTFYTAVNELAHNGIIAIIPSKRCTYFINPSIIFHGSRPNKYPDKIEVVQTRIIK
jgi:hypothetical protein